jgi:hypothetical protein
MEEDQPSFDKTIWVVQNQTKINMKEILEKYKVTQSARLGFLFHYA